MKTCKKCGKQFEEKKDTSEQSASFDKKPSEVKEGPNGEIIG